MAGHTFSAKLPAAAISAAYSFTCSWYFVMSRADAVRLQANVANFILSSISIGKNCSSNTSTRTFTKLLANTTQIQQNQRNKLSLINGWQLHLYQQLTTGTEKPWSQFMGMYSIISLPFKLSHVKTNAPFDSKSTVASPIAAATMYQGLSSRLSSI